MRRKAGLKRIKLPLRKPQQQPCIIFRHGQPAERGVKHNKQKPRTCCQCQRRPPRDARGAGVPFGPKAVPAPARQRPRRGSSDTKRCSGLPSPRAEFGRPTAPAQRARRGCRCPAPRCTASPASGRAAPEHQRVAEAGNAGGHPLRQLAAHIIPYRAQVEGPGEPAAFKRVWHSAPSDRHTCFAGRPTNRQGYIAACPAPAGR